MEIELNTFSVAGYCARARSFGVAVSTARPVVGTLVPFVSLHGAIATQARVNTDLGRHGLALLAQGVPLATALEGLLAGDSDRGKRQIHGVTAAESFAFTGDECVDWAGHLQSESHRVTVAGNMLVGAETIAAMQQTFCQQQDEGAALSACLLAALEAGQAAGGDKRGKQSAALLVASPDPRMYHNLRVDDHASPVAELRRVYDVVVEQSRSIEQEYGLEGLRLFSKVKV